MNDLEHEIREALRRHEGDAPTFDSSDARHAAARTRRRQIVNLTGVGLGTLVIVIGLVVGLGGLVRADRSPTVLDTPSPPEMCVATWSPGDEKVRLWPDTSRNRPGLYSWDGPEDSTGSGNRIEGFMHNGYGSGDVEIRLEMVTDGAALPVDGATPVTVAGCEGVYREIEPRREMWVVDIEGTTIFIQLYAREGVTQADLEDAHAIIGSMRAEPWDTDLGFRLVFMITTKAWDSG